MKLFKATQPAPLSESKMTRQKWKVHASPPTPRWGVPERFQGRALKKGPWMPKKILNAAVEYRSRVTRGPLLLRKRSALLRYAILVHLVHQGPQAAGYVLSLPELWRIQNTPFFKRYS